MDELVKRLREEAECPDNFPEDSNLMREAADAIEELSEYVNTMRRLKCKGWYLQQTKFHDGYQAVSTMPLPQKPKGE